MLHASYFFTSFALCLCSSLHWNRHKLFPCPSSVGVSHTVSLDQWDINGHDVSRDFTVFSWFGLDFRIPGGHVEKSMTQEAAAPVVRTWRADLHPGCSLDQLLHHLKQNLPQFSLVAQLFPALCDPMDCSTPVFPVHHQLPVLTQTNAHQVGDAIQPSHPLVPSPPTFNLSQHQGFFQMSQFFTTGDQSIGALASASVLPMNIQDWFPLRLTDLISFQSKGLSRVFQHHSSKASVLWHSVFFMVQLSHPYMTTGKTIALTRQIFVVKVMSLLFNMLSCLVIAFPPRSNYL